MQVCGLHLKFSILFGVKWYSAVYEKKKPEHQPNHKASTYICYAYKMSWGNDHEELLGVAIQCLV